MKKCPHCKAEIQENARFCLYCMSSLDEKRPVSPPQKRKTVLLIVVVAVVAALLLLTLSRCDGIWQEAPSRGSSSGDGAATPDLPTASPDEAVPSLPPQEDAQVPDEPSTAPVTEATEPPVTQTQPTEQKPPVKPDQTVSTEPSEPEITPKPVSTEPTQPSQTEPTEPSKPTASCSHRYQITQTAAATCTAEGSNTHTCSLCGHSYRESLPATGHAYRAATCLQPQICTNCGAAGEGALGHNYQNGSCSRCDRADPNAPGAIYEYREARAGDQLTDGTWDPQTDIVITGVKQIAADGVYEIPSYINGKRVVAIRPLAFSGTDARRVTLGKNIIYVSQNAFSGCYNISALYVRSNELYLSRSAFIPSSSRNCTLKIYCSAQCTVDDDLKGECYLKDIVRVYGGEFHEWNG